MSFQLFGLPVSRGVAIGRAVLVASSRVDVAHYFIDASQVEGEVERLQGARDQVSNELGGLQRGMPSDAPAELSALLDVHVMLLHDEALIGAAGHWIHDRHYNAEWALSAQLEVLARQFDEMENDYLRERKADVEQVVERLLKVLASGSDERLMPHALRPRDGESDDPLILVANDVAPADMLQFKRSVFTGFVTDVGGKTSHTAIVARSLDIPAVVGAREASRVIRQDDWLVIDGDAGIVIVDPSPIILEEYRFRQRQSGVERERLSRLRHTPAVTLDGERVELLANIEMPGDAEAAIEAGAVGVGLFRSEFLFMNRDGDLPGEDEQYEAYRSVVESMKGLPVTIRTVDIGADKPLDRMSVKDLRHEHSLNPALGLRAIRWSLSEPSMFRQQLRAILRASAHGPVRLLVPMLAHASEIRGVKEALRRAKEQLQESCRPFNDVPLGAMVEVPAAALTIDTILDSFDFVSLGTNDLIQYTLAIDRADEAVAHLYDPWHPAVMELIERSIRRSRARGKPVSVCGEMAGDPQFTLALLGMGLRSFSMHPAQIGSVKQQVLRADTRKAPVFAVA
jgi:phosphotransferase system enzyme I (PtsI)